MTFVNFNFEKTSYSVKFDKNELLMPDKHHKSVTCENCLSRNSSLFGAFCGEDVVDLNHHKSCSLYKKNQPLFLEGSLPRGVFCINAGKIKIFTIGEEGKEQIIHIAKAG